MAKLGKATFKELRSSTKMVRVLVGDPRRGHKQLSHSEKLRLKNKMASTVEGLAAEA